MLLSVEHDKEEPELLDLVSESTSIASDSAARFTRYAASRASCAICLSVREGILGGCTRGPWVHSFVVKFKGQRAERSWQHQPITAASIYSKSTIKVCARVACKPTSEMSLQRSVHSSKPFLSIFGKVWTTKMESETASKTASKHPLWYSLIYKIILLQPFSYYCGIHLKMFWMWRPSESVK